jgi:hypothetical protein
MHQNKNSPDQRINERRDIDQPMAFSLFNTRQRILEHPCRAYNRSETGMCFKSFQALSPGMVLCIMRDEPPPSQEGAYMPARETVLAEVKWCRPNKGKAQDSYRIGVRFY